MSAYLLERRLGFPVVRNGAHLLPGACSLSTLSSVTMSAQWTHASASARWRRWLRSVQQRTSDVLWLWRLGFSRCRGDLFEPAQLGQRYDGGLISTGAQSGDDGDDNDFLFSSIDAVSVRHKELLVGGGWREEGGFLGREQERWEGKVRRSNLILFFFCTQVAEGVAEEWQKGR